MTNKTHSLELKELSNEKTKLLENLDSLRKEQNEYTSGIDSRVISLAEQLAKLRSAFVNMVQLLNHTSDVKGQLEEEAERSSVCVSPFLFRLLDLRLTYRKLNSLMRKKVTGYLML